MIFQSGVQRQIFQGKSSTQLLTKNEENAKLESVEVVMNIQEWFTNEGGCDGGGMRAVLTWARRRCGRKVELAHPVSQIVEGKSPPPFPR